MCFQKNLWMIAILGISLIGCSQSPNTSSDEKNITSATVNLVPTEGNSAQGKVIFTMVKKGVKVVADLDGLTPGLHGFHVHENGDCSAHDGASAGAHYNPTHKNHGCPDDAERHVGDLGNLSADHTGHAHYERIDKVISLNGPQSIIGKSIIVHDQADDCKTQPTGNSGKRIACGVIESAE